MSLLLYELLLARRNLAILLVCSFFDFGFLMCISDMYHKNGKPENAPISGIAKLQLTIIKVAHKVDRTLNKTVQPGLRVKVSSV